MVFERNESKIANWLQAASEMHDPKEQIELLIDCIEEQEKAFQALRKRFEDHEVLSPQFLRKESEFQKRNESLDKDADQLREELGEFAESMKEQ